MTMNKHEFHKKLKAHDWTYNYASGPAYFKGKENEKRLLAIANSNDELSELYKAYSAFIWSGGDEPVIQESTATRKNTPKYCHKTIMLDAWNIAKEATKRLGRTRKDYISESLRQAWAKAKAKAIDTCSGSNRNKAFHLCIDLTTGHNTRQINQSILGTVFTDKQEAIAALDILKTAFKRPFIKTSTYYRPIF